MIILVQIAVIVVALVLVLFTLAGHQTHAAQAWKKIALCLLAVAMVVAVLFPSVTNVAARLLGIGRGADLLLYTFVLVFIGYAINNYLQQQRDRTLLHKLARRIALRDSIGHYTKKK